MGRTQWIRIQSTEGERRVPLRSRLVVGRAPDVDVPLDDTAASRQHLLITGEGEGVWVEDLRSTNGSWIRGGKLDRRTRWNPGEEVRVGRTLLVLEAPSSTSQKPDEGSATLWAHVRSRPSVRRALRLFGIGAVGLVLLSLALGGLLPSERALATLPAPPLVVGPATKDLVFGAGADVDLTVGQALHLEWEPRHPPDLSLVRLVAEVEADGPASFGVSLNGRELEVRQVPAGQQRRLSWVLPSAEIRAEALNQIVLHFHPNDPILPWAGWALEVREEPRPPCKREACIEEARQGLERGRLALEREALDPAQTFEAWSLIERAVYYLEALQPSPPLLVEASARLREVEALLERRCKTGRFAVVQALAFGREDRARQEAEALLLAFPGSEHPCHGQARGLLQRLVPGGSAP